MYFLYKVTVDQVYGLDLLNKILHLHCTSTVAASIVAFPRLLFATHRYSPLSVLLTFVIVNCLLSAKKLILGLLSVFTWDPLLVHDIVGAGFPSTLQDKVTLFPSIVVLVSGWTVISGGSVKNEKIIVINGNYETKKSKTIQARFYFSRGFKLASYSATTNNKATLEN